MARPTKYTPELLKAAHALVGLDKLEYVDGGLFWKCKSVRRNFGKRAGRIKRDHYGKPYRQLKVDGKGMYEHRAVWQKFNGEIPKGMVIDHIDGDSLNNRIENLRCVTHKDNNRSKMRRGRGSKSGYTGVTFDKSASKWKAHVEVDGKHKNLGLYRCVTAAACVRKAANRKYGFSDLHGKVGSYE